jgi:hypothetical protein
MRAMLTRSMLILLTLSAAAPRTFRVDYFHTGDAAEERFSLDRLVVEPLPWPGNPAKPIDESNLGKYLLEVRDRATNRLMYSRGFSSIYGEWETTPEAKEIHRTFHESIRFPAPEAPVQVTLKKRDGKDSSFRERWTVIVDPKDIFVDSSRPPSPGPVIPLQNKGDPSTKLDLLILGDGYRASERAKCEKDARRLMEVLFRRSPFKERRDDFNLWGLCPASEDSGISRPSTGIHHRSAIGTTYDAFGSERYVLTFDNRAFRDVASFAPYDAVEILANGNTYGGGGIFNLYSTVASDTLWAPYIFVHELGHHLAGLADEYFTSPSAYESPSGRPEPWEPNVTALRDPTQPKWRALVSPGVPIPTPWHEQEFETWEAGIQKRRKQIRAERRPESEMDALFEEEKAHETKMLASEKYAGRVGAFEGANYESKGYFRPQTDCVMFSRDDVPFCAVCQNAINRIIDLYAAPSQRRQ